MSIMLKLVKLEEQYKNHLFDMMDEWNETGEKIVPYSIGKNNYRNFDLYMENINLRKHSDYDIPNSTYFALDIERDIFVGAVNIRHCLNGEFLPAYGHIGDGIRPSERRKGYATQMIGLALKKCKKFGIDKVLMVCCKDNIGSAKSIINNGGILENEILDVNGEINQRYWIDLENI